MRENRQNFARLRAAALASVALLAAVPAGADVPERRQALFGDVHVHTKYSFDAYIFGIRATPDDAYRYARGETIRHMGGYDIKLKGGALDFYAVTDHAEYLGVLPAMDDPNHPLSLVEYARDMFSTAREKIAAAFGKVAGTLRTGEPLAEVYDKDVMRSTWAEIGAATERYYEPGKFTTFHGYEYTSAPGNQNLHRIVLFRGANVPDLPFNSLDSQNPEGLWNWLDSMRARGIEGLAIPHNSNVSNGRMFELTTYSGGPITAEYAAQRMRNEPIVEMSQVKGTSDTHPLLSPNDEWADFEIYNILLGTVEEGQTNGSYVRQALQRGLTLEQQMGVNPYKFGLIGSSDTHNGGGPVDEESYFGKTGALDGLPDGRRAVVWPGEENLQGTAATPFYEWSAAGLAGVWAEQNNREDIYAAMRRKETFATSGTRVKLRLFAGHGYPVDIFNRDDFARLAYRGGVAMGGDLAGHGDGAPTFLAQAMKDPDSAGLERLQLIRGWVDARGELREQVYDIACAEGTPDRRTHRCPAARARIDTANCAIPTGYGATQLEARWQDPDYDPDRRAFYYLRVLERPTCRWSTWEANRLGKPVRDGLALTIQERGWSSPIWVGGAGEKSMDMGAAHSH
ncbi:DUF3604 domain-containing protein [Altererythrobacter arenosus]|uniref:DUF3604 domain-containing protein n=1 Tax=Altererythrobacter arenosus TaxID=3032592 RepID=A0ABY8FMI8_9SPHN|nr:DUF3604 domain-containing protein [Altererythrobacter sp. CAU 1644]WFL76223.1 DUF3604 domain-containing protein [Altererythrobacter sp. CAU 1644]